jgi:hypothetical protein
VVWVALVPVAVITMVDIPVGVVALVVIVKVELPPATTEGGLKPALAPAGRPLAARVTDCAEPEVTAVTMVVVPLAPWVTVTLEGLAPTEKSLVVPPTDAVTVSTTMAVCVVCVPAAVTVITDVVTGVDVDVASVSNDVVPAVMVDGANVAVTPAGRPLALNVIDWAVPNVTVVMMLVETLVPAAARRLVGLLRTTKSPLVVAPAGAATVAASTARMTRTRFIAIRPWR